MFHFEFLALIILKKKNILHAAVSREFILDLISTPVSVRFLQTECT